jgi:hypothetical protein
MANASLNITVIEKRMLKQSEAANYIGLPEKLFKTTCPVQPIEIRPTMLLWDKRDLDKWIDAMKEGAEMATQDAILSKLS